MPSAPRPRDRKLIYLLVLILLFGAHATKGAGDTLLFHYEQSWFAELDNDAYWDPEISWRNKYESSDGELMRPLRPDFPFSTTALVSLTDGWHLLQEIQHGLGRLAIVILFGLTLAPARRRPLNLLAAYLLLWLIQAIGFHLTYTYWLV